jgi:hypothetical protein
MECKQPSLLKWMRSASLMLCSILRLSCTLSIPVLSLWCHLRMISSSGLYLCPAPTAPYIPQTHQTPLSSFHPSCQLVLGSGLSLCGCYGLLGSCSPVSVFRYLSVVCLFIGRKTIGSEPLQPIHPIYKQEKQGGSSRSSSSCSTPLIAMCWSQPDLLRKS